MSDLDIGWVPLKDDWGCPLHTFGIGYHHGAVYDERITGPEFRSQEEREEYAKRKAAWDQLTPDERNAQTEGNPHSLRNPWGLDPEIADLVIALNEAGIRTVQSCQDITACLRAGDVDEDEEGVARMGIILVPWEDFPKVQATLPSVDRKDLGEGRGDGWLFAAARDAAFVSMIFPWEDHDEWLKAVKAA